MEEPSTTISETDLTRLLPTCQRCRRLRRKCDTQLPSCRLCQKGKAECTFFDHALQQTLPRSYVHSLITRLSGLRSVQSALNGSISNEPVTPYRAPLHERNTSTATSTFETQTNDWGTYNSELSFDKHFIIAHANPTCWQFFGSSSAYSLAVEVVVHAQAKLGQITRPENYAGPKFWLNAQTREEQQSPKNRPAPLRGEISMLVDFYMKTTNLLMAFFDHDQLSSDIDTYLRYYGSHVRFLTGNEAHQYFRVSMICAIACANKSRHQPSYSAESSIYYAESLQCVEEVTSDVSPEALQALLLLILFALFYPRKGDIWKLLDFACRLSVELNYHSETNDEFEDEKSRKKRRSIFWGLYCIERTVGQHFGRPSDTTEEIITAEYPATLDAVTLADPNSYQYVLTSHYYRLTYIRSEIFRELYLPAAAPNLPRMWYEQRLQHILAWQQELRYLDNALGMGSMTCDMGFDTSICFLLQPLVLRALAATKEPSIPPDSTDIIPRESYHSACNVVEFYVKVVNGEEDTAYGMYPVTIISAHYIHQATLTIMAHFLLAIDGRLPVVSFSEELSGVTDGPIHFRGLNDITEKCLILLKSIANHWPGMVGILDIYKHVQDQVLPLMMQNGFG